MDVSRAVILGHCLGAQEGYTRGREGTSDGRWQAFQKFKETGAIRTMRLCLSSFELLAQNTIDCMPYKE